MFSAAHYCVVLFLGVVFSPHQAVTKNCEARNTLNHHHIPYRDSALTWLLRESLGGNTKSNLIVCCSPHVFNLDETVGTLRFAQRAKTIKTTVKQNIVRSRKELEQMIERLKNQNLD